jgi:hypothetical protein
MYCLFVLGAAGTIFDDVASMTSETWPPTDNPDPAAILHSATCDARNCLYEQALAKFLWFHKNALRYEPALSAVRLSFALSYWWELAAAYAPAREAFIRTRDKAEAAFRADCSSFELFQELSAMNDRLGDWSRTADIFENVANCDRITAQRLYKVAEPSLIATGRYFACDPFLDCRRRMEKAAKHYQLAAEDESRANRDVRIPKLARKFFVRDVSTFVALLVINSRELDARTARNDALKVVDDEEFRRTLDAAMTGHLPPDRTL